MKASATRDEDFIEHIYVTNMHSTLLLFTEKGLCYRLKVYELPEGTRTSKGRAIQNLLPIEPDDRVKAYVSAKSIEDPEYCQNNYVVLVTRRGTIKKTTLEAYSNKRSRAKGIIAITVREGDELVEAILTNGNHEIMIAARNGRCVRFNEEEARPLGRGAAGVRGISIEEDDEVVGMISADPSDPASAEHTVLVVSENGFGKRSQREDYRITSRGAKGVKTLEVTEKTGPLVAMKTVSEDNDLMIINRSGMTIRMSVSDIRVAGRATQGVKLINLRGTDSIAAVSVVAKSEEEGEAGPATGPETTNPAVEE
jgi:DNA gyrase subunit A